MALGSLIGAAFVRISADTKPAEVAVKGLGDLGSTVLKTALLPAANVVAVGVGAIATAFIGAGVAAGAFAAAVKPQFTAVQDASKQYAKVQDAQTKAELAAAQARGLATKSGVAYEDALAKATAAHQRAQQLSISGSKDYKQAQKEAQQATLDAQKLAGQGGTAYAAALAKAKSASADAKTAQAEYNKTLADMPPATAATAVAYSKLTDAVKKWSDSLAPKTMPIFTKGIELIQSMLPRLTPIVSSAADVIMSFVNNIGSGTTGQVFTHFGKDISDLSSGSLLDFLNIGKNLATGFVGILDSFTPMASGVTGGLAKLSGKFAEWGASASSTSGVQKFFDTAKAEAPALAKAFEQVATAATHIAGGVGPLTGLGLKVAETFAKLLNALPVPVLNQVVNAIVAIKLAMQGYTIATGLAGTATWLFSTATGASRVQMALLYVQMALVYVQLKLQAAWNGIVTAAQWLWNTSLVTSTVSVISSTASLIARNVAMGASAVATGVITAATWLWTAALLPAITAVWSMTAALLASPITWIVIGIVALIAVIVLIATKTTWFQTAWRVSWEAIKTAATDAWNWIYKWAIQPMVTAFNFLWDKVIRPIFKLIVDAYLGMAGIIIDGAAKMFGWVPGLGPKLKAAAKAFDDFKNSVNKSLSGVQGKSVTVGVNFSTSRPGSGPARATFADGGPVDGPGTETSDDVDARLSKGEHVWTAKEVRRVGGHAVMKQMRKAARGYAEGGPVGIDLHHGAPSAAAMRSNVLAQVAALAQDNARRLYAALAASLGGVIPSGQHLAVINAALLAARVPPPGSVNQWQAGLNTLITRESAWNADAINLTDSNAKAGHPSQGLAQTIPSTFSQYVPASLRSLGITNPVANVAAAVRYIVSRYGNITRVQQANANLPPQGYDVGGWLMPGATLAVNNTGRPERVVGPHESMSMTINLTVVNQGVLGSQRDVMNWLISSLQTAKTQGRLRGIVPTGP